MKAGRYKELFTKINTDMATDEKIYNKLQSLQEYDETINNSKQNLIHSRTRNNSLHRFYTKVSGFKQALPSLAFMFFLVVVLIGYQRYLFDLKDTNKSDIASSTDITYVSDEALTDEVTNETNETNGANGTNGTNVANGIKETLETNLEENKRSKVEGATAAELGIDDSTEAESSEANDDNLIASSDIKEKDVNKENDGIKEGLETTERPELTDNSELTDSPPAEVLGDADNNIDDITDVSTAGPIAASTSESEIMNTIEDTDNSSKEGEFYFAWFQIEANSDVKTAIPYLIVRFHGSVPSIDPSDLTDIELTKDGNPIDNTITLTELIYHGVWNNEVITDFYFKFINEINEPGTYGLTGKYKGVPFKVDKRILEASVSDEAANPEDLLYVAWGAATIEENKLAITGIDFVFKGLQNTFYLSDLTELELTCNDKAISFSLVDYVRYYEVNNNDSFETMFEVALKDIITESGAYTITGKYKGKTFTSWNVSIP